MLIATWNVNSLRVRLPHVLNWLSQTQADVLCLQETKVSDNSFPYNNLAQAGYQSFYVGQSTYNGVAIIIKNGLSVDLKNIVLALPNYSDLQKRLIALTVNGIRFVCAYIPNGDTIDSDKYNYKLTWLSQFKNWLKNECMQYKNLAVLGDFNIAPEDQDVHDPVKWKGRVLVSDKERAAFKELLNLDLVDAFRLFTQPVKSFSWWDYRMLSFIKNAGLRIDHILLNRQLTKSCIAAYIDKKPRELDKPSDHTPVIAELQL